MRLVSVMCLVLALGMLAGAAFAGDWSAPKNWYYQQNNIRATYPEQEPNDSCGADQQMVCGDVVNPAYLDAGTQDWYAWNANIGDMMTMWTGPVNQGDNVDTYIELYANDCSSMLAYNDDSGSLYSRIENFAATYTGVYHLKVRGYGSSSAGPYAFHLECGTPPPPQENDICSGAIEFPTCTSGQVAGDLTPFHNDYDPSIPGPSCTGYSAAGKDATYKVQLNAGDRIQLAYCGPGYDDSFYIVTDCANVSGTCVAGADDTVAPDCENIDYTASTSGLYYIIADAYGTNAGTTYTLDYNIICAVSQACCFQDGHCEMQMPADCRALGGVPEGAGTDCSTYQCPPPVATQPTTWGQIKSNYR